MTSVVLITGATSGIGLELAKIFISKKYDVLLVSRNQAKLDEVKVLLQRLNQSSKIFVFAQDLSKDGAGEAIKQFAIKENLEVGTLINNAGFAGFGEYAQLPWSEMKDMIRTNIEAVSELTSIFLPRMIELKQGKIMNLASTASFFPGPLMAVYYATKAYVLSFSQALSEELKNTGVTVTAVCPGPTVTNFQERAKMTESRLMDMVSMTAMTADRVALIGYEGLINKKRVVVVGLMNKLQTLFSRLLPGWLAAKIVYRIQEKKSS